MDFMEYINDTSEVVAAQSKSPRVKLVHSKVKQIRRSEKCGVKYMQRWEEIAYAREDGYEKGRNEGALKEIIAAVCKKLVKGKSEEQIADSL